MVSLQQLKSKQSGFTIVELLIVIVIIAILAGLVITTFVGIQARARDSERQTDINAVQKAIEAYYATNGGYPTVDDLNDGTAWRKNNGVKLDAKALADPSSSTAQTLEPGTAIAGSKKYYYAPTPTSCVSPTTSANPPVATATGTYCNGYTLTARLESKAENYTQQSQ